MSLLEQIRNGGLDGERFRLVTEYAREHFKEGHKVLEVGSDDGAFCVAFCMIGYNVVALDPETIPSLAQLYIFKRVSLKDWYKQHSSERFEIVHLGEVIEHVEDPDEMMKQACHVCSGKMIVSAPNFQHPGHVRTYDKEGFTKFVEQYMTFDSVYEIKNEKTGDACQFLAMGEPKK